jgi:hypothetical protein
MLARMLPLLAFLPGIAVGMSGAVAPPRAALLEAIAPLDRGFAANNEQKKNVKAAIEALTAVHSQQYVPDISGDWELIYTDAPDILGLDVQAGPLATCTRIGQQCVAPFF